MHREPAMPLVMGSAQEQRLSARDLKKKMHSPPALIRRGRKSSGIHALKKKIKKARI